MKSINLKEERGGLVDDLQKIHDTALNEKRDLNEEEVNKVDEITLAIDGKDNAIERAEKMEKILSDSAKVAGVPVSRKTDDVSKYSFFKHIRKYMGGNLDGLEAEVQQEAERESRGFGKSIGGIGLPASMVNNGETRADITSNIAGTSVQAYVDALRDGGTYEQMGATILRGLSADARIPVTGKNTVAWAATENAAAADGGVAFSSVTLSPSRLTSKVNISRELLAQNGTSAETAVLRDLGRATAQAIDAAIFSEPGISNAPTSIPQTSNIGTFTETAPFVAGTSVGQDFMIAEETLAAAAGNKGTLGYVCSPAMIGQLKQGAQVSNVNPIVTGDMQARIGGAKQMLNGYPVYYSTGVDSVAGTSADAMFADWSALFIGYWGGVDILLDPYTNADANQIRVVLNTLVDWQLPQPASFVWWKSLIA